MTVSEEPRLEDLSRAVTIGLLAEEVVYATSQLIRGQHLDEDAQLALEQGRALLDALVRSEPGPAGTQGFQQLIPTDNALDTLRAVRAQVPIDDVRNFLDSMISILDYAIAGEDPENQVEGLEAVRALFLNLGHVTLARANSLSPSPEDRLTWLNTTSISASSSPVLADQSRSS